MSSFYSSDNYLILESSVIDVLHVEQERFDRPQLFSTGEVSYPGAEEQTVHAATTQVGEGRIFRTNSIESLSSSCLSSPEELSDMSDEEAMEFDEEETHFTSDEETMEFQDAEIQLSVEEEIVVADEGKTQILVDEDGTEYFEMEIELHYDSENMAVQDEVYLEIVPHDLGIGQAGEELVIEIYYDDAVDTDLSAESTIVFDPQLF